VILSGIGKRYAVALFNVANNENIAEQVGGDIVSFANLFSSESGFRNFLMSPMVNGSDKKDLVDKVIGGRASDLLHRFVTLLIDKKRLGNVQQIADAYMFLYEQAQDIVEVRALTAIPLDRELEKLTQKTLQGRIGTEVRLVTRVDPGIIGGMILFAQDKIIDGSVRYRLARARKALSELRV